MGVRITGQEDKTALFDSVTDMAFGPVFDDNEQAQLFLDWYEGNFGDPRDNWFLSVEGQRGFLDRYNVWHRATHDDSGFRIDIAIQLVPDK